MVSFYEFSPPPLLPCSGSHFATDHPSSTFCRWAEGIWIQSGQETGRSLSPLPFPFAPSMDLIERLKWRVLVEFLLIPRFQINVVVQAIADTIDKILSIFLPPPPQIIIMNLLMMRTDSELSIAASLAIHTLDKGFVCWLLPSFDLPLPLYAWISVPIKIRTNRLQINFSDVSLT